MIAAAALSAAASVSAQVPPADSAEHAVLDAINGGHADRAALVAGAFSSKAFADEAAANDELEWFDRIATDSEGLALVSSANQGDRMVEAIVRTKRGGKFGKLVLFTSSKEPGKISNLFLLPARDPARVKAEEWPKGKLPRARLAAEIDKRASAVAAEDSFSGVVLVAKGNRVLLKRAYGLADQQWRIANRADTKFHLGSVGKMFTAAAILKLAEQGRLGLDDPVSKWVPEFALPEASRITLKQLLTHSAGLGDLDVRQIKKPMTGAEIAATMTQTLQSRPGERFSYSNGGFVLLQAVVEKATGKPFGQALDGLVFGPAGMTDTGLWPVTAVVPNRATGYLHGEDTRSASAPAIRTSNSSASRPMAPAANIRRPRTCTDSSRRSRRASCSAPT